MKKVLSLVLALVMILSIGTVGASAAEYRITVAPTVKHVRQDDIAYYPVKFDVSKINGTYAELCESNGFAVGTTHIELGYSYRSDTLSFIDAIPEEALYNLGGTVKVTEHGTDDSEFNYFFIEIDFSGSEGLANEYFFNLKFEVLQEKFINSLGVSRTLIYDYPIYADYENMIVEELVWEVTDSNGTVHDLSSKIDLSYASFGDGYTSYDQLLIKDYEPFIPPVEEDVPPSKFDDISVDADVFHARIGEYAYFPLAYDCDTAYKYYVGSDENSKTKIVFPFLYMPDLLEPIEAIPSELLYNMGGTVKITEFGSYVQSNGSAIDYFFVEVSFDGYEGIIDEAILFNIKCKVLSEEFFDEYETYKIGIFDNFNMVEDGSINFSKTCSWKITMSDGTMKDISSNMQPPKYLFYDEYDSYNDFVLTDYIPFIPPVDCDITEVTYIQQEDTHKDFTVTANGRKSMIQFMEPDGGTRTYDRYHKNVTITSYNADGEEVSSMARDLAYEVWEIYSNMSVGNEIKVRGKENGKWDAEKYSFTIEPYNPIISMELSSTSGKLGPVPATVVADDKTEKVMFKMPDNTTVTVASTSTDENGNKIFTGNAWMNKDGLNEIRILIYRNSVWRQVGTLEYTVE